MGPQTSVALIPGVPPPVTPAIPTVDSPTTLNPVRCSTRFNTGTYTKSKYIDKVFLANIDHHTLDTEAHQAALAYLSELHTCFDTGFVNITDPQVYAAKKCGNDADNPTFHQAINGPDSEEFIKAMKLEIMTLESQKT